LDVLATIYWGTDKESNKLIVKNGYFCWL